MDNQFPSTYSQVLKKVDEVVNVEVHRAFSIFQWLKTDWINGGLVVKSFFSWVLWMLSGSLYYGYSNFDGDLCKGFYYAVNVGYSVGWSDIATLSNESKVFSIFFLLIGAIAMSRAIGLLIEVAVRTISNPAAIVHRRKALYDSCGIKNPFLAGVYVFLSLHWGAICSIYFAILWVFIGIMVSCYAVGWSFIDGAYFAISAMSTGGLYSIPYDAPSSDYLFVASFTSIGVPLLALACGNIGTMFVDSGNDDKLERAVNGHFNPEVLEYMKSVAIMQGDATLNEAEYVIMMLVQSGLVDISLVDMVTKRFHELDLDSRGVVSIERIIKSHPETSVDSRLSGKAMSLLLGGNGSLRSYDEITTTENVMINQAEI